MSAAWMWVRSEWRRAWGGLVALGVLIAIAGGVTMAAAAGARRADSAIARFQVATNDPQAEVELATSDVDELQHQVARLPSPAALADRLAGVNGVDGVTVIDFIAARAAPDGEWFNGALGAQRRRAPTSLVTAGRAFHLDDPYEVMVNEPAAAEWGSVGSELTLQTLDPTQFAVFAGVESGAPAGPTIRVRVVGIIRGIEEITDVPEPFLLATPAFVERFRDQVAMFPGTAQVAADPNRIDEIVADLGSVAGADFDAHRPDEDFAGRIDESVSVEVTALRVFAIAAAIAGLVIVYQAMSRGGSAPAAERSTRRALGFTRRLDVAASVVRVTPAILLGVAGSVASAIVMSALLPRGIARRAEPSPGVRADWTVLAIGAAAILGGTAALAATSGWAARRRAIDHPTRFGLGRVAGAIGPASGLGLRLAYSGSRRARASRAGIVAVTIAVAGVLAVTSVDRSAARLTSTPRLFGAGWDAAVGLDAEQVPDQLIERLMAEPDVVAIGSLLRPGDEEVDAVGPGGAAPVEPQALVARAGPIAPTLVAGRLAVGPGEVAIGATVVEQLGADIGDTIELDGYGATNVPFVVVGRVINAGTDELGNGFDVTEDGLRAITAGCPTDGEDLRCMIVTSGLGVALRRGVDVDDAIANLRLIDDDFVATPTPSVVYNLRQIGVTPWYLAVFLAVLGVSGLAHALASGRRLGRHDVAVTRALGFSPRQTAATVCWHALVVAAPGAVAGVVIGLLTGRLVWRRVAEGAGALVETVLPAWAWVAAPAAALLVAVGLAIRPAIRIARERPAGILRTE
jgi:hypothetical protein